MNSMGARFGYGAGTGIVSVAQLKADALWAEAAGFESFWVSQVFAVDPIVALAAVGSAVPGFRELGTSVVPLAGRHPLALGAQARTAQSALDGRFTLGIGPSHQMVIEGFYGESYKRIFGRTEEFLSALGPLLNGEPCGFEGEQIFAKGWLTIEAESVPMLLAALGPKMLELAGRATAGTSVSSCGPKTIETHIAPLLNEAAERAGRDRPRIVALVGVCVTEDAAALKEFARPGSVVYDSLPSYRAALDREGVASQVDLTLTGSIDDIAEGFASYIAAGVTDLRVGIWSRTNDERTATQEALASFLNGL